MESVAAEVKKVPIVLEASRVATEALVAFDEEDVGSFFLHQAPRSADACGASPEYADSNHDDASFFRNTLHITKHVAL
jgi:hypothetical protein